MSKIQPFDRPAVYRIRVKAHLGDEWSDWFEGLNITCEPNGESLLCGLVTDQAALYGLLKKARDMGLGLVSVTRVDGEGEQTGQRSVSESGVCARCQLECIIHGTRNTQQNDTEVQAK